MPYVAQDVRNLLNEGLVPLNPGQLNYTLSQILRRYLEEKEISYATYNEIIGVLECLKLEFYRRLVASYEDTKREVNGDVW